MLSFNEHYMLNQFKQLDEKLIMYNNGKRYGQVVFLAGGAGSGKGFAQDHFMEVDKFKVFDVDELKRLFIKVRGLKMDLKNPRDVFNLHKMVRDAGVKDSRLNLLAKSLGDSAKKGTLPNLMFDVTLKDMEAIKEVLPFLSALGYDSKDIHVTWVLANYYVAVQANQERPRVVPDDILLQTHVGAAKTMSEIVKGKLPRQVNGEVRVILNNRENTVPYVGADGKPLKTGKKKEIVVKDFTYVTLKKRGKPFEKEAAVQRQVFDWIHDNVPRDALKQIKEPDL